MNIEEHIAGLRGIKPFLQRLMAKTNYEGKGEQDAVEIGETMDAAIEALDKQIPKRPDFTDDYMDDAYCPRCGIGEFEKGTTTWESKYCPECGQKILWEENE